MLAGYGRDDADWSPTARLGPEKRAVGDQSVGVAGRSGLGATTGRAVSEPGDTGDAAYWTGARHPRIPRQASAPSAPTGCHRASTTPAARGRPLTAEATPRIDLDSWTMSVDGLVGRPQAWTWGEVQALPVSSYVGDIHCVTTWSKFDMTFRGVSVDTLLDAAMPPPEAGFVLAPPDHRLHDQPAARRRHRRQGVDRLGGRRQAAADRPRRSGAAARPAPLLWKSAKWITRLELLERDRPGFWEQNGYHDRGDPGWSSATRVIP